MKPPPILHFISIRDPDLEGAILVSEITHVEPVDR